jgi:hypothetical protein
LIKGAMQYIKRKLIDNITNNKESKQNEAKKGVENYKPSFKYETILEDNQ